MHVLVYDIDARGDGTSRRIDAVAGEAGVHVRRVESFDDLCEAVADHEGALVSASLTAAASDQLRRALARRRHPLPWVVVVNTPRGQAYRQAVEQALRQGAHEVLRRIDLDGERLTDALAAAATRASVGVAVDVSTARLASVGRLAAGITRQLSNPTTYVLGNLAVLQEMLDDETLPPSADAWRDIHAIVADCREGMGQLQQLAIDMSVLARLRAAAPSTTALHELVDRGVSLAEPSLGQVTVRREQAPGYEVRAQGPTVVQVVASLVVRMADRAEGKEVRVATRQDRDGAVVEVVDPRARAAATKLRALLDETRVDTLSGLELVMFRDALRAQGGELEVVDRDGKGLGFRLVLPLAGGSEDRSVTPEGVPPPLRQRVLVVDDDLGVLRMLHRVLKPHHDVVTAPGGKEAIERLTHDPSIAFVLCDLMMPEVDGVGVYHFVAEHRPDLRRRFAILTGGAVTPSTRAFVTLGVVPVINKPVEPDALVAKIRRQITRSQRA